MKVSCRVVLLLLLCKRLFRRSDFTLWNIFRYLSSFQAGWELGWVKVHGSDLTFLVLYQGNQCTSLLTVPFPSLEISEPVQKQGAVVGILILASFHAIQRSRKQHG